MPSGIDYLVFDFAVNAGCGGSAKVLQRAVGVVPDGGIGPITLAAVNKHDAAELIEKFRLENKISPFQMIISPKSDVNTLPNMVDSPSRIFPAKRNATQRMKNVATV